MSILLRCLLHVRGGVSEARARSVFRLPSSPRPWRCFVQRVGLRPNGGVFSTSVEVFLMGYLCNLKLYRLLHVRGGVSRASSIKPSDCWSSPRPWRCFCGQECCPQLAMVFSTSVEVFLYCPECGAQERGLLHVRGGVSVEEVEGGRVRQSSPRPWRCFYASLNNSKYFSVFSTSVEVFLLGTDCLLNTGSLLHVRGGVSN